MRQTLAQGESLLRKILNQIFMFSVLSDPHGTRWLEQGQERLLSHGYPIQGLFLQP